MKIFPEYSGIIKQAGGADNIVSATHCMTRLRLVLRDRSKFDTDAVKQVPGVLNVIIQNGEYQVVIGQDVPDLYEEVVKIDGIQAGGSVQDDEAAAKDLAQDHGNHQHESDTASPEQKRYDHYAHLPPFIIITSKSRLTISPRR